MTAHNQEIVALVLRHPWLASVLGVGLAVLGALPARDGLAVARGASRNETFDAVSLAQSVPKPGQFGKLSHVVWRCGNQFLDSEQTIIPGTIAAERKVFAILPKGMPCDEHRLEGLPGTVANLWPARATRFEDARIAWRSAAGSTLEFWVDPDGRAGRQSLYFGLGFIAIGVLLGILGVRWWCKPPAWSLRGRE